MNTYYRPDKVRELGQKTSLPWHPSAVPRGKRIVALADMGIRWNAFDVTEELGNHPDLASPLYIRFEYYVIDAEIATSIVG